MLLAVFGAGASYDAVPRFSKNWPEFANSRLDERMPLANELFDARSSFQGMLDKFPECHDVVPRLRKQGVAIEQELGRMLEEANHYSRRKIQLAAVKYYLQMVIWECTRQWTASARGVTNYRSLIDDFERLLPIEEGRLLVTFNYDTMLDEVLESRLSLRFANITNYIHQHPRYKLFKVHGSTNWGRLLNTDQVDFGKANPSDEWNVARAIIACAERLDISTTYQVAAPPPFPYRNNTLLFPAIAIPVEAKSAFECPQEHLDLLVKSLPEVTRILIIGWRGADQHFVKLLASKISETCKGLVVSGTEKGAEETIRSLQMAGITASFEGMGGGFTPFIENRGPTPF